MLNFYRYCNGTGLDNDHHGSLIDQLMDDEYTIKLKPIEHIILKKPIHAYRYALNIKNDRWLEAEPIIMKDAFASYWYTKWIIKERWPEAESVIMKDPRSAYNYAKHILEGRWEEAEPYIKDDRGWWVRYCGWCKTIKVKND